MPVLFFIFVFCSAFVNADWDVGVITGHAIELLTKKGGSVAMTSLHGLSPSTMAYDPLYGHIYFNDNSNTEGSIFQLEVSRDGRLGHYSTVVNSTGQSVNFLAHDPITSSLFWTTGMQKKIMTASLLLSNPEPKILHSFEVGLPKGIVVDPCTRQIFWTNCVEVEGTIESSLLDGTNRSVIISKLHLPTALTILQSERKLYWAEIYYGREFILKRSNLDGTLIETVQVVPRRTPESIAVTSSSVFWIDDNRELYASHSNRSTPFHLKSYTVERPRGLVVISQYDNLNLNECNELNDLAIKVGPRRQVKQRVCLNGIRTNDDQCQCYHEYTGPYCEKWLCENYCLAGGTCAVKNRQPSCTCPIGYYGRRCELSESMCDAYCMQIRSEKMSDDPNFEYCLCNKRNSTFSEPEAEKLSNSNSTILSVDLLKNWQRACWILSGVIGLIVLVVFFLVYKVYIMSSRPKLIRKYQVTAPKGGGDHCEIAIENCCNMNICETPCYEPEFRTPKKDSKKEEKKTLLDNMEAQCRDNRLGNNNQDELF